MNRDCFFHGALLGTLILAGLSAPAAESVCIEAETAATLAAPVAVADAGSTTNAPELKGASAGKCLVIPEGAGKPPEVQGTATFRLVVRASGEFYLWQRVWWSDSCGNSVTVVVDDGKPYAFGQDGTYKSWHWVRGMKLRLDAGSHELRLENREDGIAIDQLLLTSDLKYVPVGIEEVRP